jgi:hypothetical protein
LVIVQHVCEAILLHDMSEWIWNNICAECHRPLSEPLPPPVDIQTSCDLVVWRNAPNISYEDITGYEIKLLNLATNNEEVIISDYLNASATFYSLHWLNETLKSGSTFVQVGLHLY